MIGMCLVLREMLLVCEEILGKDLDDRDAAVASPMTALLQDFKANDRILYGALEAIFFWML